MNLSPFFRAVLTVGIGMLPMVAQAAELPVSASESDIQVETQVPADGYSQSKVTIIVRDKFNNFLAGKRVFATFSKPDGEMALAEKTTDTMGRVEFTVRSTTAGTVRVVATADGVHLNDEAIITFVQPAGCLIGNSRNIFLLGYSARETTYFYGGDCKRHAYPEHAYESWYGDGSSGGEGMTAEVLAGIKLGAGVSYRPGTLIRFQDSPRVYIASSGGVLRPIASEAVAQAILGDGWAKNVRVISVGYFITSVFGREINGPLDVDSSAGGVELSSPSI
jgi:hypothetical protein